MLFDLQDEQGRYIVDRDARNNKGETVASMLLEQLSLMSSQQRSINWVLEKYRPDLQKDFVAATKQVKPVIKKIIKKSLDFSRLNKKKCFFYEILGIINISLVSA